MSKKWFDMKALSETEAEISIFDEIGGRGISAKDFEESLKALGAFQRLTINISSPGGSCVEGNHIYNVLAGIKAEKTAKILGYACSMASVIAMAADKIIMPDNTFLMIHNPWMSCGGDAEQLRKDAALLDKVKTGILSAYGRRSGKTEAELSALMDAETWLSAKEAAEIFNNVEVVEALQIAATVRGGDFKNMPAAAAIWIKSETVEPEPPSQTDGEKQEPPSQTDGEKQEPPANENEQTENTESNPGKKPAGAASVGDFERGRLAGMVEGAEGAKGEIEKLRAESKTAADKIERLNAALNEKQSKLDKSETLCGELAGKLERLLKGGFTFEAEIGDWSQALAKCGGDYVEARKRYPAAFDAYMNSHKKRK